MDDNERRLNCIGVAALFSVSNELALTTTPYISGVVVSASFLPWSPDKAYQKNKQTKPNTLLGRLINVSKYTIVF